MILNIEQWLADNRHLLVPPVGNKVLLENNEFLVMIVAGPNARSDYHYNEGTEFFYQLEGEICLKTIENNQRVDNIIKAGEMYLLPPKTPHSPVRPKNTLGLVIERKRKNGEKDGLLWFCQECHNKLYEEYFVLESIEKDFLPVFKRFHSSLDLRTCKRCGAVHELDHRYA